MFMLLRILFIVLVLLVGWFGYRYLRTRDRYWLRLIRGTVAVAIAISVIGLIGLVIQRLTES
ncbi:MAG TPA: hypothetical protein VLC08_02175 [Chitinolyticbacter sp.]|uniref:hypothetical protein n=1 Tax=Chitinolyticbacter albus TaxID=2961951 RepID=UPI00210AACBD|nr:hypothetical protein [Chitinolyticbacter albus]HSC79135.1 hypothetical protein [Chitinolyticbacter sp.]